MMAWLINFIAFQLGWIICVVAAAQGWPWLGSGVVALIVVFHLSRTPQPGAEFTLVLLVGLLGGLIDTLWVQLDLLRYSAGIVVAGMAPHWIIAMWMLFAITLNVSLRWLRGRWLLAALFGAIGGPLAYYAGAKLGAVVFTEPAWQGLATLALAWAGAMPLLMWLAQRCADMATTNRRVTADI